MNLTTSPITISAEQNYIGRPEFIRLPKPGKSDPWTGLSRSVLNQLVLPCKEKMISGHRFVPVHCGDEEQSKAFA